MQCSVDHDSSSQATAGSRPVGSPWKATLSVPPILGVVLDVLAPPPLPELLPQPATSQASPAAATTASSRTLHLKWYLWRATSMVTPSVIDFCCPVVARAMPPAGRSR